MLILDLACFLKLGDVELRTDSDLYYFHGLRSIPVTCHFTISKSTFQDYLFELLINSKSTFQNYLF